MNATDFASKIRAKYPGAYDSLDDNTLTQKIIQKYPEYSSVVDSTPSAEGPGLLKSAAAGLMSGVPLAESAIAGGESLLGDKSYEQAHKGLEDLKDQAWSQHPVAYGAGKTAGLVGTGLVAPEGIPGAIGVGAASGLDSAANVQDIPKAVGEGAAVGGVLGTIGEKVVSPLLEKLPGFGKSAVASLGKETTAEDVSNYLANPKAINSAMTKGELGEGFTRTVQNVTDAGKQMADSAKGLLNEGNTVFTAPLPELPSESTGLVNSSGQEIMKDLTKDQTVLPDTLAPVFERVKANFMENGVPKSLADKSAIRALDDQYELMLQQAQNNGGKLSELDVKNVIERLQKFSKAAFDTPDVSASKQAQAQLSGALNGELKQNKPFSAAMEPVAELNGLKQKLVDQFGLNIDSAGNVTPSDQTASKVMNALKEGKTESFQALNELKDITGIDYLQKVKDAMTAQHFNTEGAGEGLRNLATGAGFGVGHMTGLPYVGWLGAAAGRTFANSFDGGQIAKGVLDAYLNAKNFAGDTGISAALQKYGPMLAQAAKAGGTQLAATHFVLATSHPEYQNLVNHLQDNQPQ